MKQFSKQSFLNKKLALEVTDYVFVVCLFFCYLLMCFFFFQKFFDSFIVSDGILKFECR